MLSQMKSIVLDHNLINKGDKIVVAVSGGADSVALLHGLYSLKEVYEIELYVCHLNHQLRGQAADGDAEYVKELSDSLGIKSYIYSRDIERFAKDKKMGFEEAAREVRYDLFEEILNLTGSNKIAVAQNKNDQAETILMRLFRGSGLEGLTATKFRRDLIIRPLLGISRKDIESYCSDNGLSYRTDHTNFETDYTRNKIRLELIPYIQEHFNENIIETLYDTTRLLSDDQKFIESYVDDIYKEIVGVSSLILEKLPKDPAILSRLFRKIIANHESLKGVSYSEIKALMQMVTVKKHGNKRCIKGLTFEISYDKLVYYKASINMLEKTPLKDFRGYRGQLITSAANINKSFESITIDADKVKGHLYVRSRIAGDRFSPLNMKGSKKLKDFFIDLKVPASERDHVILLCDDDNIIWVVGYRMSDLYKVTAKTKNKTIIQLQSL